MPDEFWTLVIIIIGIVCYFGAKVVYYARKSDEQWQQVDKSKLKVWDDDEEW